MSEPWTDRRKRLEDIFPTGVTDTRVQLVPTLLKDRRSAYKPGTRSRSWWKAKHKLVLPVEVLHCAPELAAWGDWGQACVMGFVYRDPRSGAQVTVEQAIRVPHSDWTPRPGPAEVLCWGVLRSGLLRHPVWVGHRVA